MGSVAHDTSRGGTDRHPVRVLGIFAHPDDETLCAGGTFAKYASAGADVRVVSLTKGEVDSRRLMTLYAKAHPRA